MRDFRIAWSMGLLTLFWTAPIARADLIVTEWLLETGVSGPESTYDFSDLVTVQMPFSGFHSASIKTAYSDASYSFNSSGDAAAFWIGANNRSGDVDGGGLSISDGHVLFTPAVDTLVSVQIHYDYDHPGTLMSAVDLLSVGDETTGQVFLDMGGPVYSFNGPVTGAFDEMRQAIIPGGCDCGFGYQMKLDTFDGSGLFATGSGYTQVTLQQYVPEPAAFLPLIVGVVLMRARRQKSTRRSR